MSWINLHLSVNMSDASSSASSLITHMHTNMIVQTKCISWRISRKGCQCFVEEQLTQCHLILKRIHLNMWKNVCIQAAKSKNLYNSIQHSKIRKTKPKTFHSESEERNDTALRKECEDKARVTSVNMMAVCKQCVTFYVVHSDYSTEWAITVCVCMFAWGDTYTQIRTCLLR